jgi:iron complex transport system substrate-binding protein
MSSGHTPRRVVSLQPSATVTLRDIGKLDALVACTRYCLEICPEIAARGVATVADSWTAQAEQISQSHPDLVIACVPYQERAVIEILKAGVRFLGLAPRSLADIYTDITAIAGIMDAHDRGNAVIKKIQAAIEAVRARTRDLPKPRVFCEEWAKPLIASQPWVAELVEAAGGEFIGIPGVQTDAASVLAASPDVLIAAWCGAGDRVPLDKIAARPSWEQMPAVRNRQVYCIPDEYLNTPASTLLPGLRALAAAIHPECFPHVDGLRQINSAMADFPKSL